MARRTSIPTADELRAVIRGAGLRSTPPRVAVLGVLHAADTPLSHADLVEALDGRGYDRVTLFRNLNDLAEVGLVVRTDLVLRFDPSDIGRLQFG